MMNRPRQTAIVLMVQFYIDSMQMRFNPTFRKFHSLGDLRRSFAALSFERISGTADLGALTVDSSRRSAV